MTIAVECDDRESLHGLLLRMAAVSQLRPRQVLKAVGITPARPLHPVDVDSLIALTGADRAWLLHRVPIDDAASALFSWAGQSWRSPGPLSGSHAPACPRCVHETGVARLEWDLTFYGACPVHRLPLVARCPACGRTLTWQRPAVDVCRCRRHLRAPEGKDLPELMFVWLQWIADSLKNSGEIQMPAELRLLFPGAVSIDGTWRIIRAFGVIAEDAASDVASTGPEKSWAEAARGLKHLAAAAEGRIAPNRVHRNFLRRQWIRGVTAGDRGLARHYLRTVGERLDTEWRSRQTHQFELFEL